MCFVGMSYNPGFDVEHQKNTLIWFSYKQKPILLFKQQSNAISDQIVEARKDNAKVVFVYNDVEEKTKNLILNTTKSMVKICNTTVDLTLNIKKSLSTSLGNEWHVMVSDNGFESDQHLYKNISIPGNLISFRIESIEFIIFRLNLDKNLEEKVSSFNVKFNFFQFSLFVKLVQRNNTQSSQFKN